MDNPKNKKPDQSSRKSLYYFIGSLVVSLALTWLLWEPEFTDSQVYTLFLLFFAVSLWITEAIPPFAVGLFILAYLTYTFGNPHLNSNPEKIDKYVNTFSSSIIWLMLGGFFLAAAMTKTRLDRKLLRYTLHLSGTRPKNILIALMFSTMLASMLMSGTATTAMIVATIMPLLRTLGKSDLSKGLLLGITIAAATGGMATIIGSPTNALAAGILENAGISISFLEWMFYGFPLALLLTIIGCWALMKKFVRVTKPISLAFLDEQESETDAASSVHQKIVVAVLIVTFLLWLTTSWHDITVAAVSAIPIVFLTLTGVLTGADIKTLPWDTLLLIAGGLSLGTALQSTQILEYYIHYIKGLEASSFAIILILAFAGNIFSNVMSNSATTLILVPLGMTLLGGLEKEVAICIALANSTAIFLPISTTPNTIAYSTELVEQKDFRLGGTLFGLLGPILAALWVMFLSN